MRCPKAASRVSVWTSSAVPDPEAVPQAITRVVRRIVIERADSKEPVPSILPTAWCGQVSMASGRLTASSSPRRVV